MRHTIPTRISSVVVAVALAVSACSSSDTSAAEGSAPNPTAFTTTTEPAPTTTAPPTSSSGEEARTPSAPSDYREGADYAAAHAATLAAGREALEALLGGDIGGPYSRFSEQLKGLTSEHDLQAGLDELRTDRVHFEEPEANAAFDGRLTNGTISGSVTLDGNLHEFSLESSFPAGPTAPPVGQWEGAVVLGETSLAITVTFETEGKELRATIDIPDEGLSGQALEDVRYEPSREIGKLVVESVLPHSEALVYATEHAWGPSSLVTTLAFDSSGTIVHFSFPHEQASLPPDPAKDLSSETEFRLPFDGVWWVTSGGPTELQNHHVTTPSQRHGYDLVVWQQGGAHRGDGSRNEDYWAWEEPVLAPADGTVVAVLDGLEDNTPGVLKPEPHPAGNNVVIETGADEYLHIAHFRQGSIQVDEGDEVTTGDVLGLTGNSGNSSGPHIHIHLQDNVDFFDPAAIGLPLPFTGYLANGESVSVASPLQGQLIQPAER